MPNASKAKGNRFEVSVAKMLSEWSGKVFRRVPNSGALRWRGASSTFGDLLPPEELHCIFECKSRNEVDLNTLLTSSFVEHKRGSNDKRTILGWWKYQLQEDCARFKRETALEATPILIFKQDHGASKIAMELTTFMKIIHPRLSYIVVNNAHLTTPIVITNFTDFTSYVSYDDFREACRRTSVS